MGSISFALFCVFGVARSQNGKHALGGPVRVNYNKAASRFHVLRF